MDGEGGVGVGVRWGGVGLSDMVLYRSVLCRNGAEGLSFRYSACM